MDNTSRVAQWRQRMRDEGKEAVTVWLSRDAKLRLEDLASVWHSTPSAMVEQALEQFHPGSPPRIGNDTDAAQLQVLIDDRLRAMLPGLKEQMLQELRHESTVTATNGNVTVIETVAASTSRPAPGKNKLTPLQAAEMRGKKAAGVPIKALVEEYGISRASVFRYLQSERRQQGS